MNVEKESFTKNVFKEKRFYFSSFKKKKNKKTVYKKFVDSWKKKNEKKKLKYIKKIKDLIGYQDFRFLID